MWKNTMQPRTFTHTPFLAPPPPVFLVSCLVYTDRKSSLEFMVFLQLAKKIWKLNHRWPIGTRYSEDVAYQNDLNDSSSSKMCGGVGAGVVRCLQKCCWLYSNNPATDVLRVRDEGSTFSDMFEEQKKMTHGLWNQPKYFQSINLVIHLEN